MHLVEVLDQQDAISRLQATVVLVAYDDVSLLGAKMLRDIELPYPLLLDERREAYTAWGMGRTNLFGAMLSPSLNARYLRLLLRGERFLGFAPDMFQLGGDFVVDRSGRVILAHRMRSNGDRAPVAQLIAALTAAAAIGKETQ